MRLHFIRFFIARAHLSHHWASFVEDRAAHVVGDVDDADLCLMRSMPTARMNKPVRSFCWAKTCSTAQRTRDFVALPGGDGQAWGGAAVS
jgi:hypothetical protein